MEQKQAETKKKPNRSETLCRNGDKCPNPNCKFKHPPAVAGAQINPIPCSYYSQGKCRDGPKCRFSHIDQSKPPQTTLPVPTENLDELALKEKLIKKYANPKVLKPPNPEQPQTLIIEKGSEATSQQPIMAQTGRKSEENPPKKLTLRRKIDQLKQVGTIVEEEPKMSPGTIETPILIDEPQTSQQEPNKQNKEAQICSLMEMVNEDANNLKKRELEEAMGPEASLPPPPKREKSETIHTNPSYIELGAVPIKAESMTILETKSGEAFSVDGIKAKLSKSDIDFNESVVVNENAKEQKIVPENPKPGQEKMQVLPEPVVIKPDEIAPSKDEGAAPTTSFKEDKIESAQAESNPAPAPAPAPATAPATAPAPTPTPAPQVVQNEIKTAEMHIANPLPLINPASNQIAKSEGKEEIIKTVESARKVSEIEKANEKAIENAKKNQQHVEADKEEVKLPEKKEEKKTQIVNIPASTPNAEVAQVAPKQLPMPKEEKTAPTQENIGKAPQPMEDVKATGPPKKGKRLADIVKEFEDFLGESGNVSDIVEKYQAEPVEVNLDDYPLEVVIKVLDDFFEEELRESTEFNKKLFNK